MNNENIIAKVLFESKAIKVNVNEPFTFASGIKSPIYCDNRFVLGFSEYRNKVINAYLDVIDYKTDVIVGIATAGIPWASIIADRMCKPLAYVRNKPKDHGKGNQIEGADINGKKVVIIEDLITTGKSSLVAVEALKNKVKSMEVISIFSYGFKEAAENYQKYNTKFSSLSNFDILLKELQKMNYLNEEEINIAKKWNKDPQNWLN